MTLFELYHYIGNSDLISLFLCILGLLVAGLVWFAIFGPKEDDFIPY